MMERKKIEYLVVDTGAFLKNANIADLAENAVTCQEVVNEVTSKRQLRRLVVLPFELQIKDVFPENVSFVTEFSKKTGDYPSLSATDIKVIALTYQLEKEKVGSDHLREAPEAQRTITFQNRPTVDPNDVVGFYIPTSQSTKADKDTEESDDKSGDELSQKLANLDCAESNAGDLDACDDPHPSENLTLVENIPASLDEIDPLTVFTKITDSAVNPDPSCENNLEASCSGSDDGDGSNSEDSDGGGWITPGNISQAKKQMNAEFEEDKEVTVACVTTDFAMQNVLKQIGLNVSSVDGRVIKQLRTYILRCYACFKTTSIMTKIFCPHCGHKTLKRVAVSVEPDGSQKIHINLKKPLTSRGKKFSMPTFQGGKHANNPIIFADQPVPDQRPSRLARTKTNILDEDYIPGFSPFAMRDTTSKSAMLGIRGSQEMKHWMRRNPNEAKPHSGRKKKK